VLLHQAGVVQPGRRVTAEARQTPTSECPSRARSEPGLGEHNCNGRPATCTSNLGGAAVLSADQCDPRVCALLAVRHCYVLAGHVYRALHHCFNASDRLMRPQALRRAAITEHRHAFSSCAGWRMLAPGAGLRRSSNSRTAQRNASRVLHCYGVLTTCECCRRGG